MCMNFTYKHMIWMYFSYFFLIEKFWYYLFYGIVLVLWVWTNLDKKIDPYNNILGIKEDMVYALVFCLKRVRGWNWVFIEV